MKRRAFHVLMMPDFREANAYQVLLARAVEQHGVRAVFSAERPGLLPLFRTWRRTSPRPAVLHLHWLLPYWHGEGKGGKLGRLLMIAADLLLLRLARVRVAWTVHNLESHEAESPRLERLRNRIVARLSDRLIVHNKCSRRVVSEAYDVPRRKIAVIPIGHYRDVHPPRIDREAAREKLGLLEGECLYVHLGNLRPYKGVDALLKAWKGHESACPKDRLIVGGAPGSADYAGKLELLSNGLKRAKILLRRIDEEEMALYLSAADVAVLPFEKILTSSSLVLAMSYGVPVIAPRFATIEETLGPAGTLLYEKAGEDCLYEALARVHEADMEELSRLMENRLAYHDWEQIGKMTVKVYEKRPELS